MAGRHSCRWIELFTLIESALAQTALLALSRQKHRRRECLNDALIYLTAAKAGFTVLTANMTDFDLVQQIAPEGRFVYI